MHNNNNQITIKDLTIKQWRNQQYSNEYIDYYYGFSPLKRIQNSEKYKTKVQNTIEPLQSLLSGNIVNITEAKAVTHHQCRDPKRRNQYNELKEFCNAVHANTVTINGHTINTICQIGIGGSISGPKAIHYAIKNIVNDIKLNTYFISNHDEDHIKETLSNLIFNETLFIIISKSGTTIEVEKILASIIKTQSLNQDNFYKNQCITVTTKKSPLDQPHFLKTFTFDTSIGGRFSTTSLVGLLSLGLSFGSHVIDPFLDGAYHSDQYDVHTNNLEKSMAFNSAYLNVGYRTIYKWLNLALIPYGNMFEELPVFLTQLISESLGKTVRIDGETSDTENCPHILHGIGPSAQHSFFQQLHQSTPFTPCEFIYAKPNTPNQHHMLQQICGQMVALANGKNHDDKRHYFSGNRPSTFLYLKERSIEAIGALIAHYENRVLFEGLLLNINAFDQPGVELGKNVTKNINDQGSDLGSEIVKLILE